MKIALRNYRSYDPANDAEIEIGNGFTGIVGVNNAGKSTLLRAIYEMRSLFGQPQFWIGAAGNATCGIHIPSEPDPVAIFNHHNEEDVFITITIDKEENRLPYISSATMRLTRVQPSQALLSQVLIEKPESNVLMKAPFTSAGTASIDNEACCQLSSSGGENIIYSTVRFTEALSRLTAAIYFGPYRNPINDGAANHFDMAVGTALVAQWDEWKAGNNRAHQRAIARVERDVCHLLRYDRLEINANSTTKSLNVAINGNPMALSDLGAGVAELVMTFANALVRKPSIILVDEPESHLHPSLQTEFLTVLATYSAQGIVFSTHSISLARAVADSLYIVRRDRHSSQCEKYENATDIGGLFASLYYVSFAASSFCFILLVEGPSETKLVQVLLRKIKKDHLYSTVSLGGSSMIHRNSDMQLTEIIKIAGASNRVFAIIDSEKRSFNDAISTERTEFISSCEKLSITCHVTERRATENYFSDSAVKKVHGAKFRALQPYETLQEAGATWKKSQNWQIGECEDSEFFDSHDLGKFLKSLPTILTLR